MHLQEHFKEYVREKYVLEDSSLLKNNAVLQMIYALEWFDVPRTAYADLIEFHPDLTVADQDRFWYAHLQHYIENGVSFSLFGLLSNRYLLSKGPS